MEVVAGVAGVAGVVGILGLVGQAVHGILKLKEFAHGVLTASETIKDFLEAIDSLESTLAAISDLLKRVPEEWLVGTEAWNTKRLTSQVEKCQADVDEWVKEAPVHQNSSSKAMKSFFKKLRVASNGSTYGDFHQKVARHLQGMQMSLDLLACSYNIHILQQGGVIAEEVKSFAQAQTSLNHESTQRFLEFDKSFVHPVSSQLDRLETSSQMSSASISSLASDVTRILELVSSKPVPAATAKSDDEKLESNVGHASSVGSAISKKNSDPLELRQQPPRTQMEWSCHFLPGIEAAFSASGFSCLYCGDEFDQESAEWSLKGRHLVDEHRYGECNLLLAYDSETKFAQHVQEFHQCSLGFIYHLSNELLNKHCHFGRGMGFHRGTESKDQNLTDDFHSIRGQRCEALSANNRNLKAKHNHHVGGNFIPSSESAQEIQPVQWPWELDLQTAISEEGCIVNGLMVATIFRPWSFFNPYGNEINKLCYSLGDGIKVSRYELDDRFDSLFGSTRLLRTQETNESPGLSNANLIAKSSAVSVLPKGSLDGAEAMKRSSRVNSWLQEILKSSSTTQIIMFHMMKKHGVDVPDLYTWLEKVLEFWEMDEAATKVDEPDDLSDGAVDSRGSFEIRDVSDHEDAKQLGMPQGWRPYLSPLSQY